MAIIPQLIANGIIAGGIYALIAVGYSLIYTILKFINFAHGEMVMFGAFIGWVFVMQFQQHIIIAALIAMLCCGLMGYIIEKIAYKPLRKKNKLYVLLTAIAMSFLLQGIAILIFGAKVRTFSTGQIAEGHDILGAIMTNTQLTIIVVSLILLLIITCAIKKTKIGKAIRAVADNQETAQAVGIPVDKIISIVFIASSMIAAVSGILIGYEQNMTPTMGVMLGVKAFTAAVVGGIGNVYGAFLGGYIIGLAENLGIIFLPAGYKDAIAFIILMIMLYWRPTGLLGKKTEEEVRS
jgi:branched-chain amino acid transport system permease protein